MTQVGILGAGQLGQMLTQAAIPLGLTTNCLAVSALDPAGRVGPITVANLQDFDSIRNWARRVDIVTYEWENFPAELVAAISEVRPIAPPVKAIAAAQDRAFEKQLFVDLEIPIPAFRTPTNAQELTDARESLGGALMVKTRTGGYDGLGQLRLEPGEDPQPALDLIQAQPVLVEQVVDYEYEASIIAVRSVENEVVCYPVCRNMHQSGILFTTHAPCEVPSRLRSALEEAITRILKQLDYVGVLALEVFVIGDRFFANEFAPRVHNSGHWTIEGAETSQFENHIRAVAGLPLGSAAPRGHSGMVNLVGSLPDLEELLSLPGTHLHLYGKTPRPGRKLAHVTVTADTPTERDLRMAEVIQIVRDSTTLT